MNVWANLYILLRRRFMPKNKRRWMVIDSLTGEEYTRLRAWMVNSAVCYSCRYNGFLFTQAQAEYITFYINMHDDYARHASTTRVI